MSGSPTETELSLKKSMCESYCPVRFSASDDTERTVAQVRSNNAVWVGMGCKELVTQEYLQKCYSAGEGIK